MIDPDPGERPHWLRDDELSAAYRRLPRPAPPHVVDRRVIESARVAVRRRPWRDALAYAASALLALAVLFAFEIRPGAQHAGDDAPHFVRTAMRSDRGPAWPLTGPATDRAVGSARCTTRAPGNTADAAGSPRRAPQAAETRPKLREPCSARERLR